MISRSVASKLSQNFNEYYISYTPLGISSRILAVDEGQAVSKFLDLYSSELLNSIDLSVSCL